MSRTTVAPTNRSLLCVDTDVRILFIVLFLIAIGVSMVASSSSFFAGGKFSDHFALTRRHIVRSAVSLIVLVLAMRIDYRIYRKISPMLLAFGVALMVGLFFFGHTVRGSQRWMLLPVLRMSVQPSDIARITLIFFLAYWITRTGRQFTEFRSGFLPAAGAVAVVCGLIAITPDYGTASVTALIALIVMFVGGARMLHLLGFMAAGTVVLAMKMATAPHVRERIAAYMSRGENVTDVNWQVYQSLIGLGSGGLFGVGVGDSEQKLSWLPDAYTDFVFSILGEETGLIGTLFVSGLFLLFALRALKISRNCDDTFGEMLVVGIGSSIFVYAMLNMFVATGLVPVTGLPLPFLSYGGSALVVNAFAVGVLLNVARKRTRTRTGREAVPA
ncbi:MAG: cell division protein FtsW [Candidatus Krumholzibacteriota bacterium]|nr:cell division protein FtsW [Candidatus Krumholzibacteriota bacterium]